MAAVEYSTNLTEPAPPLEQHEQQSAISSQYPEMIMEAIEALNEKEGSSQAAISLQMEATHSDLPPSHAALLSRHLDEMTNSGQLVLVKNNYMKRDPHAPPKRGRGRPPKVKDPAAAGGSVVSPPRPRGRPPKPRDPAAPSSQSNQNSTAGSGKPRGRPPKMAKTEGGPAPAEARGVKRGRGRPPKVEPAVAPVAG